MFKLPLAHQKKQKILNYEIKVIEECSDSLFNSANCSHERYLEWNLYETLRGILQDQSYQVRWMGNDRHSYIYSYFYIAITACSKHPAAMVELKSVLYDLASKYLSQYEQKLLIQFLCLIEYSQEKYLFFRKYNKIETILVKLFQQIQVRNTHPYKSLRNSLEEENFSKLTTCITSPCKSLEKDEAKVKELQSAEKITSSLMKSCEGRKRRFMAMFEIYGKYFHFVKIQYLFENLMKFNVTFERISDGDNFYVCLEKQCFFVVEVGAGRANSSLSKRSCSILEEEKQYLQQLLQNERNLIKKSNESVEFQPKRSSNEHEFTPKFISNKKKRSLAEQDFYQDGTINKNVNIQVLDVRDFDEKQPSISQSRKGILHYKKKIETLGNINNTIKSIDLDKQNLHDNFTASKNYYFGKNDRKIMTEQAIPHHKPLFGSKLNQMRMNDPSKRFVPNQVKKHTSFNDQNANRTVMIHDLKEGEGTTTANESSQRINPENTNKTISNGKFSRETLLSAHNLKRFNKQMNPLVTSKPLPARQFHSHSPRNRIIEMKPSSNYNAFASPLKPRLPLKPKDNTKFKFTYL